MDIKKYLFYLKPKRLCKAKIYLMIKSSLKKTALVIVSLYQTIKQELVKYIDLLSQTHFIKNIKRHPHYKIFTAQMNKIPMNKTMRYMLMSMIVLFGLIYGYHTFKNMMIKNFMKSLAAPPVYVSTLQAKKTLWQEKLTTVGNIRAIQGVDITTELPGMVKNIVFEPGSVVKENEILVELNNETDIASLQALEASAALSRLVYERDKAQYAIQAVSKAQLDTDEADLKAKNAQVQAQSSIVQKKIIKAPFSGRLGISKVNPGQYLNAGASITTLQQLDPLYVDFFLPQQDISKIRLNQTVELKIDAYPNQLYKGKITTVNPIVDSSTRNIEIEATLKNNQGELLPGMFSEVSLYIEQSENYITLPQTAISYNPYGDIVYIVVETDKKDNKGKPILTVSQQFVKVGNTRGDQIAIIDGVKENDIVVTSGQTKLKNGSTIIINNQIMPENNPTPEVSNNK